MSRRWRCLLAAALLFAIAAPARADTAFRDWNEFWGAFTSWSLDPTHIADVHSLILDRDAGTIVLEQGRIAYAKPFGGRRVAMVFTGRGSFVFAPRSWIEREQLRRFYGAPLFRRSFERLTLIVADTTFAELAPVLHFHSDTLGQLEAAWRDAFPYLTQGKLHYARPLPVAQMLLDGVDDGLFWALLTNRKNDDPNVFSLIPEYAERVVLERQPEDDRSGMMRRYNTEVISSFAALGDPDSLRGDERAPYEATHYAIDVSLDSDLKATVTADLDLLAHDHPRQWIGLELPPSLTVDDVTLGGRPQSWYEEDDNPIVWVRLDHPIPPESTATVRMRYHGRLFDRQDNWAIHKYSSTWYPKPWVMADATWDLTFHWPGDIQLVSCGQRIAHDDQGPVHSGTWRLTHPVPWVSFDVNYMRGIHVTGDSMPPVTVWLRHLSGAGRVENTTLDALRNAKDYDHRVAFDVAHALQFFTKAFGPPLAPEISAVETPLWRYEGYPGLVHMMRRGDPRPNGPEYSPEVVRVHEISHQWFGLSVTPATYHDAWLREGFANFCSLWYLEAGRGDRKDYLEILDSWRDRLLENRRYLLGQGQEAGPISLGTRANTSSTPRDYQLVIYAKGAWVLHMLRDYLLDESDPNETRFRGLLRDFYTRYAGRPASTEDFRRACERATGEDMKWFFDEWVYGTDVPVCRFQWSAEPSDGQWKITGRIETSNVPATFRFPVILRVDLGDGRLSRQRVWVKGPVTEFELPPVPARPADVVFNDLDSVLCDYQK